MLELLKYFGLPSVSASTQGPAIDNIISIVHWMMLILFIGWGAFFIYTLIRFRASNHPKADYHGVKSHFSSYLEGVVAIIEIALLFGFAFPIWATRINDVPQGPEAVKIRVIAQQFAWNIHYPGPDREFGNTFVKNGKYDEGENFTDKNKNGKYDEGENFTDKHLVDEAENPIGLDRTDDDFAKDDIVTVNQLHIPVNTPINISLSSKDVIHSFTLTELRVKQDAVPGMVIPVWFEATMTTEEFMKTTIGSAREGKGFEIACAQLCGLGHYRMKGFLTIHDDEGYAAWHEEQQEYLAEEEDDDDWGDDW